MSSRTRNRDAAPWTAVAAGDAFQRVRRCARAQPANERAESTATPANQKATSHGSGSIPAVARRPSGVPRPATLLPRSAPEASTSMASASARAVNVNDGCYDHEREGAAERGV